LTKQVHPGALDPIKLALQEGALPERVEVGQVYERVAMRLRDGSRWKVTDKSHTRIRITAVAGGSRRNYYYVKVDPVRGGNGRPDRQEHRIDLLGLSRHYALVLSPPASMGQSGV
jgi:hypothetical protein